MSSSLVRLAALRLQLGELERTPCARCGHTLSLHKLTLEGAACRAHLTPVHKLNAPTRFCKCVEFCDTLDEQLSPDPQDPQDQK